MDMREFTYKDDFDLLLKRQGWHDFTYKSIYNDPDVIKLRWITPPQSENTYSPSVFYDHFGNNTFRKLLRAIFSQSRIYEQLVANCSNKQKLDDHLNFMKEQEIVLQKDEQWNKAPQYEKFTDIGKTLEWYIAEWFRFELKAHARHGVNLKGIAEGGDLDVIALIDGLRIMVECKSGNPAHITERQLDLFLERVADFNPNIAILLLDTESDINKQIDILNTLRKYGDALSPHDKKGTLFWGIKCIYVVNTRESISSSLYSVLRLYHTKIKYLSFWG